MTLRSGTKIDGPVDPKVENLMMYKRVEEEPEKVTDESQVGKPIADSEETITTKDTVEKEKSYLPPPPYKLKIPYPRRLAKTKNEGQFKKFIELLKQLHVTIPFTEAIIQMASYAKFLKEILSNKKKLEDDETMTFTIECSTIIQNNMPPKLKNPSNFSIPCVIGKFVTDKTLSDLIANISLMHLSICEKLKLGDLRPTRMFLQLTDRSIKYPMGMLENIPVCIDQFYIPSDFVVMDIKEDSNIPIFLGRPFLATAGAIIDVKRGKLTFEL
ncbi:uncharacterized protein LOC127079776 [Lathyrus oleraceus]|uniref:uncharacterized protein LOC127079776 n=1 Tax=Pisum sativum TaxID=3888 RepID=UPI0021CE323A|nr:uncharacterized protein LOC127079776 [Pisum sativum]